ncbi:MAG: ABC transporter substrate binding protein [Azospirillaceae bacterium]|nr:ABC transporter substrate binding protein [Azospirillaceae bacterium]
MFPSRRTVLAGLSGSLAGSLGFAGRIRAAAGPISIPLERVKRVIVLTPRKTIADILGFRDYLQTSSSTNKLSVQIDIREVEPGEVAALIPQIRAAKPDLILTIFTPITLATVGRYDEANPSAFITDIPVVFSSVTDPVASHIVQKLEQPDRPVTGTRHIAPMAVQMKTIMAYRPWTRIAAVYNPAENNMVGAIRDLKREAALLNVEVVDKPLPRDAAGVTDARAIPDLVREAAAAGAQLLYIGPDTLVASNNNTVIADAALTNRLATFCCTELPIRRANLLMGLVSPAINVGRLAGIKAEEILTGTASADRIPIETLNRFSLLLRIGTARTLDLYPPMKLLNIAEIIQDS